MNEEVKSLHQIKAGGVINYLLISMNILLGLVYTPWILHEIGSSNYGLYTLATSLIVLFLMDFGMSAAVTRFISNFRAEGRQSEVDSFVGIAIKFYAVVCSIGAIALAFVYFNIDTLYGNLTAEELPIFKVVFIISAFFIVTCFPVNIYNGILNAYEEFVWLKGTDILNKAGTVIVTILALLCHGGLYALVFINGMFNLLTLVIKAIVVRRVTPVRVSFKRAHGLRIKDIFSFTLWSTVSGISQQFMFNIIPSILARIANTTAITLYGFANVIEGYVYTISSGLNGLFMPKVSRIIASTGNTSDILPLMVKVGRVNLSIVSLLVMGLTVFGKEFVRLWIGNEYAALYPCILLLSFPYVVSATQQIGNTCITVVNKVIYPAVIGVVVSVINVFLCILLCPEYGVIGVCAGTSISFIIRIICLNCVYLHILKLDVFTFFKECHLKMFPALIVASVLAMLVSYFWQNPYEGLIGWLLLGVRASLMTVFFVASMWFVGWNDYERNTFFGMIKFFN